MSNYASLLAPLTFSGSRLSDGTPNATGNLHVYLPGTTTPTNVYADPAATILATQPIVLDNGGRIPVATYANGLYVTSPVRLLVKDVTDTVVISDVTSVAASAGNVGVSNAAFTGTNLDAILSAAGVSFGGQDWKFKDPSASTNRTVQAKFEEIWISVKDFGAAGDGIADDTTAIQSAINRIFALGGGVLYFPAGTYKISSALTMPSLSTGITLAGSGITSTVVNQVAASTDALDIAQSSGCGIRDMAFSGGGVIWTTATSPNIERVNVTVSAASSSGMKFTSSSSNVYLSRCNLSGASNGLWLDTVTNAVIVNSILGSLGGGSDQALNIGTSTAGVYVAGTRFSGTSTNGVLFASGSGSSHTFVGCPTLGTMGSAAFNTAALSADKAIVQVACRYDEEVTTIASPATVVPRYIAQATRLNVTSGTGTVTLSAPSATPVSGAQMELRFINGTGGSIAWSLAGAYAVSGAIPTSAGSKTTVGFWWNGASWVEKYRAAL